MKVYSLYHNETYVASFPNKIEAIDYGKENYMDGWECNIVEEYFNKTPYQMYAFSPSQTIPCTPSVTLLPETPQTNNTDTEMKSMVDGSEYTNSAGKIRLFNINSNVKVRLTKHGKELHKQQWKDFWSSNGRLHQFPYTPPKEDENGYAEFQMWDLMEKFGAHCGVCKEIAFETIILIDERDLK